MNENIKAGADIHAGSGGYSVGTKEGYEAFVKARNSGRGGKIKHGYANTRLYTCWQNMKARCYNKNSERYPHYGAKGVIVCDQWLNFENFKDWAEANGYSDNLTIDRINPKLNYEPSNCRWLTYEENHALMMLHNLNNGTGIFSDESKSKAKISHRMNSGKITTIEKDGQIMQFGSRGEVIEYLSKILNRNKESIKSHVNLCLKGKSLSCGGYKIYE